MKKGLNELAEEYNLNFTYGYAPKDYSITRAEYPGNDSAISLFVEVATPAALAINNTRSSVPSYYILNSGILRFDMFEGTFTRNDQLTASPFKDAFIYLPNMTFSVAKQVLPALNDAGASNKKRELRKRWMEELYARGEIEMRYRKWLEEMHARSQAQALARREENSTGSDSSTVAGTLGYVTTDVRFISSFSHYMIPVDPASADGA